MNTLQAASPDEPKVIEFAESPGRRLRVQRQAKGLEIERIATQLHLRPNVLEALEQDRYHDLPGPVFVVGYLRNYARLVGLDPQPLIEAYRANAPESGMPPPRVATTSAPRPEVGSSHLLVRLVSLALIAAVIAMLVLWWQNRAEQLPPLALEGDEGTLSMPEAPPAENLVEGDIQGENGLAAMDEPALDETEPGGTQPIATLQGNLTGAPAEGLALPPPVDQQAETGEAEGDTGSTTTALAETTEVTPSAEFRSPAAAAVTAEESDASGEASGETGAPTPDPTEVALSFSGPCWIQVKDAAGAVVLTGSMVKGDQRVLDGTPPFSFIIGNASNTRLTVGGQPFDLASRTRGNVARFTLNPGAAE
jgi:cytoskeleton protein RodZ